MEGNTLKKDKDLRKSKNGNSFPEQEKFFKKPSIIDCKSMVFSIGTIFAKRMQNFCDGNF